MFPSFDFEAALAYLKLLHRAWLYAGLGFSLDRHADKLFFRGKIRDRFLQKLPRGVVYLADKRPGNHWVPTWKRMWCPNSFCLAREARCALAKLDSGVDTGGYGVADRIQCADFYWYDIIEFGVIMDISIAIF